MADPLLDEVASLLRHGRTALPHPLFPGAVFGIDEGDRVLFVRDGLAYAYADASGTPLPAAAQRAVTERTRFDLASVTKLFTATVVGQLVERGLLALDDPVGRRLDGYDTGPRARVTVRQLLAHTSGLPSEIHFWQGPDPASRRAAVLGQPLEAEPGSRSRYSCVGYLTLGLLVELVLGQPLDVTVQEQICAPLALGATGYRPLRGGSGRLPGDDRDVRDGIAATEMRRISWSPEHDPQDPDPRGVVHDENAASLGGVAGNAGLFSDARDLLTFGRAFLDTLRGSGSGLGLSAALAREMVTPQLDPGMVGNYQSGLGWRIDDRSMMTGLLGQARSYGHPGFTGTSLLVDESRNLVCTLLTNRVHPSRTWSDLVPFRQQLATLLAAHYPSRS